MTHEDFKFQRTQRKIAISATLYHLRTKLFLPNTPIQSKSATEQYFPVVLFIMLYKVVLTFESLDEILMCDHSNKCHLVVLLFGVVYYTIIWCGLLYYTRY